MTNAQPSILREGSQEQISSETLVTLDDVDLGSHKRDKPVEEQSIETLDCNDLTEEELAEIAEECAKIFPEYKTLVDHNIQTGINTDGASITQTPSAGNASGSPSFDNRLISFAATTEAGDAANGIVSAGLDNAGVQASTDPASDSLVDASTWSADWPDFEINFSVDEELLASLPTIPAPVIPVPDPILPPPPAHEDLMAKGRYQLRVKTATRDYAIKVATKEWDLWRVLTPANRKKMAEHRSQCWVTEPGLHYVNEFGDTMQFRGPTRQYFDLKVHRVDQSVVNKLAAAATVPDSGVLVKLMVNGIDEEITIDVNRVKQQGIGIGIFRCPVPACTECFTRRFCVERHFERDHKDDPSVECHGHPTMRTYRYGDKRTDYERRPKAVIEALKRQNGGALPPPASKRKRDEEEDTEAEVAPAAKVPRVSSVVQQQQPQLVAPSVSATQSPSTLAPQLPSALSHTSFGVPFLTVPVAGPSGTTWQIQVPVSPNCSAMQRVTTVAFAQARARLAASAAQYQQQGQQLPLPPVFSPSAAPTHGPNANQGPMDDTQQQPGDEMLLDDQPQDNQSLHDEHGNETGASGGSSQGPIIVADPELNPANWWFDGTEEL